MIDTNNSINFAPCDGFSQITSLIAVAVQYISIYKIEETRILSKNHDIALTGKNKV